MVSGEWRVFWARAAHRSGCMGQGSPRTLLGKRAWLSYSTRPTLRSKWVRSSRPEPVFDAHLSNVSRTCVFALALFGKKQKPILGWHAYVRVSMSSPSAVSVAVEPPPPACTAPSKPLHAYADVSMPPGTARSARLASFAEPNSARWHKIKTVKGLRRYGLASMPHFSNPVNLYRRNPPVRHHNLGVVK